MKQHNGDVPLKRRKKNTEGNEPGPVTDWGIELIRPPLPSILLANIQSVENKMDKFTARIQLQSDIRDCNILCFTQTWLPELVLDCAECAISVTCSDRTEESGKPKGGSVCIMMNSNLCCKWPKKCHHSLQVMLTLSGTSVDLSAYPVSLHLYSSLLSISQQKPTKIQLFQSCRKC